MSSTAGTRPVPQPRGGRARPAGPVGQGATLGLLSATGLVMGTIVGVGVFTMPAVLASAGTSSLVVLAVVAVGAMALAILFGQLTKRVPNSNGGLYAYARHEFGDFAGYLSAWSYWISSWPGNAAIAVSWVFYVNALFGISHPTAWSNLSIALAGIWVPAAVNLAGLRQMAWFQNATVVLKFLPLLFVGVVGWFFVSRANFGPFRDLTVAGTGVLFSMWVTFAAGYQAIYDALIAMLVGIVLYAFLTARREDTGQIPEPADNPPDDSTVPTPT